MSRIEQFKNAVQVIVRTGDRVSMSLVGAKVVQKGNQPAMYTYGDGRTCSHSDGEMHNCAYVSARNRLIYAAEQNVKRALIAANQDPNGPKFDAPFMAEMTRLWRERAA